MKFRLLGPLEITDGDRDVTPTAPKLREVLALLVLRDNQIVPTELLIDELWGVDPPVSALSTLQTYIYKLRKLLWSRRDPDTVPLKTKPAGYILEIPAENADCHRFFPLLKKGSNFLEHGEFEMAAQALREALGLWRGPQLADVEKGELLSAHATRLAESRLTALELRVDADLQLGRHRELVSELRELTSEHPMHEGFRAKLMTALQRSGRRSEALEAYQCLRRVLVDELGLEPSAALRHLQQEILASESEEEPSVVTTHAAVPPAPTREARAGDEEFEPPLVPQTRLVPAQLPADIADFAGRDETVAEATRSLTSDRAGPHSPPILVFTGMPGSGKSALAVRIAHNVCEAFPGGQLYVDLKASSGPPRDPYYVLGEILQLLGLRSGDVPDGLECRSQALRTWTAARRTLVVLDDAYSVDQVRPLLPGSAGCAVLITSRLALTGLAGAQVVEVDALDHDDALRLLAGIIGGERVEGERRSAEEIIELCERLPLAVRCAGARLADSRGWPLSRMAEMLRDERGRLDALSYADIDVRGRVDRSYRRLDNRCKSALRLLSLLHEGRFQTGQVAELLGCSTEAAEEIVSALVSFHLIDVVASRAGGEATYRLPELIRLYAQGRLEEMLDGSGATAARGTARGAAERSKVAAEPRPHRDSDEPLRNGAAEAGR